MTDYHLNFSSYIAERTQDFTGREWVFAEIDRWLADPEGPSFFILTGEPGIGKTAIAGRLTQIRDIDASHFCIARQSDTIDPFEFTQSISAQLTEIPDFLDYILLESGVQINANIEVKTNIGNFTNLTIGSLNVESRSPSIVFNRLVLNPLKKLCQSGYDQLVFILIDALDEAAQLSGFTIVDILANLGRLPPQIRFLLTTRPESSVLRHFENQQIPYFLLDAGQEKNQSDARQFVSQRLKKSKELKARLSTSNISLESFINQITEASHGNFLYLVWVLSTISESNQSLEGQLTGLPKGLDQIYREFLLTRKVGKEIELWKERYRPLLSVLVVAHSGLSIDQIMFITGQSKQSIRDHLSDLHQFFDPNLIKLELYGLFHQSLADFLIDEVRAGEFWIDSTNANQQIAAAYLKRFFENWDECDQYGLFYLPTHLASGKQSDKLIELLTDFSFIEVKLKALHNLEVNRLINDYSLSGQENQALRLIQNALRLSASVFTIDRNQLAPQLLGRLIGYKDEAVERLLKKAKTWNKRTWIRPENNSLTPAGGALEGIFTGHEWEVKGSILFPDGRRALSMSVDGTMRIWDLEIGRQIQLLKVPLLEGHRFWLRAGAVLLPDYRRVLSWGSDSVLRLWDLESGKLIHALEGHQREINGLLLFADGKRALSWSDDKTLRIWDLESGNLVRTFEGHQGSVDGALLLPDGRRALSWSDDKTLRVWDLVSGGQEQVLEGHKRWISGALILTGGQRVLTWSVDSSLRVWNLEDGRQENILKGHKREVTGARILSDDRQVLSWSADTTLRLWDLENCELRLVLEGHLDKVEGALVLPDGRRVLSWSRDKTLRVWDLESGDLVWTFEGQEGRVNGALLFPDGRRALSWSDDKTLHVWDLEAGRQLQVLEGHHSGVAGALLLPDGRRMLSWSQDATLRLWNLESGQNETYRDRHADRVEGALLLQNGHQALSWSRDKTLRIWDLERGGQEQILKAHKLGVKGALLLPDGQRALSWSDDNFLCIWDLKSGKLENTLVGHHREVMGALLLPFGSLALSWSLDRTLRVWDLEGNRPLQIFTGHKGYVQGALLLPDGQRALSWSNDIIIDDIEIGGDNTLRIWDLNSGQELHLLEGHRSGVLDALLLLDGHRALSWSGALLGQGDNTLRLWDLDRGNQLKVLAGHHDLIKGALLLPDGRRALSWSQDKTLRVWDLDSGDLVRTIEGHEESVNGALLFPDGRRALSWSQDKTLRAWDLDSGDLVKTIEGHKESVNGVQLLPGGQRALSWSGDRTLRMWNLSFAECLACYYAEASITCCLRIPAVDRYFLGDSDGNVHLLSLIEPA